METSADLIDLNSIEQLTLNPNLLINSMATSDDHVCESSSIKPTSVFKSINIVDGGDQLSINNSNNQESFTSRRTKERIDEFEAQLECFMKTKKLLLEQFTEETQNLTQKHEREILGLRQKHLVCENNFKSQLENASQRIKNLEAKMESEQTSLKLKIELYEEDLQKNRHDAKINRDRLENALNEKEKQNDELKRLNLNLESQLNLLSSEFKNRRQQLEDKLHQYEINQEKDLQEIKKLRDELNHSLKEISILQRDLFDVKEKLEKKENDCLIMEKDLANYKDQIQVETEFKKESVDRIQALRETLKVSQTENDTLQIKLAEIQTRMTEEIEKLKSIMVNQQSNYEQRFRRLIEEKTELEERFKSETASFEKNLEDSKKKYEDTQEELQRTLSEKHKLKHQLDVQVEKSTADKQSLEHSFNTRLNDLNKKLSESEQKLKTITEKYESTKNELIKTQNYMAGVENDLKTKNSTILNVHEKYNLLEMDRLSLLNELENVKRFLHLETVEKKEKLRQIEELNNTLLSSQVEIEKLKNINEQLKRSLEDGDNLRFSLLKDCNELRETLAEVEKSRLEIKSKLNSCQFNCASLNNQLKKKDLEIDDLKRKLNTYGEEKKFWQEDLDSTSQSLTQMKTAYEKLYQQNVLLQNKISHLESETNLNRTVDITKQSPNDKETLRRLTRECQQSRERIAKLESEKRHFERQYINIEREYNNLKNSFNSRSENFLNARSPSPITTNVCNKSIDDHSVLSLTRLLKNDLSNVMNPDFTLDDTNRSLEALRQKNIELKQKVLNKQNTQTPNHHENHKKVNEKISNADFCECLYHHQHNHQNIDSTLSNMMISNQHQQHKVVDIIDLDDEQNFILDENRNNIVDLDNNVDENSFDEKLKQAELNAQKVLESCEPEIKKLTNSSNKMRVKSAVHQYKNPNSPIGSSSVTK